MGYRIVRMNTELFSLMMTEGQIVPPMPGRRLRVVKGLPEGAKLELVAMELWLVFDQVALKYSHPSWAETPPSAAIPILDVEFVVEDDVPDRVSDLTPMEEAAIRFGRG